MLITTAKLTDPALFIYIISLTYYVLKKKKEGLIHGTEIRFVLALLPYAFTVSIVSASAAAGLEVTYSLTAAFGSLTALVMSMTKLEGIKAYTLEAILGITSLSFVWTQSSPTISIIVFIEMIALAIILLLPIVIIYLIDENFGFISIFPIFGHFLDASSTVLALDRGLQESRVLAGTFIEYLGSYGIFLMKALIIIPVVYFIERKMEEEVTGTALFMIGMYGLVLGLRNYFLIFL